MTVNNNFLKVGLEACNESGKIVLSYYKKYTKFSYKNKFNRDLVSEVDIIVENKIKSIIKKKFPRHQFEGEETGVEKRKSKYKWIIDPIDGTVNYIHGIPMFSISLAMQMNKEIQLGIILNPVTNEIYFATKNKGAFLNGERILVSSRDEIKESLFVVTFSSEATKKRTKKYKVFGKLNDISRGCLRIGSASLGLAYLASGKIEGLWGGRLKKWDIAAGICIVKEAGGKISNIKDKKFSFGQSFVATNGKVHKKLLNQLKEL